MNLLLQTPLVLGTNILTPDSFEDAILFFVKILFVIGSILYALFAVVIVRQIFIMKNTLITTFSPILLMLGFLHLLMALGVVWLTLVIL